MKQYKDYGVDDFLSDNDFIHWVRQGSPPENSVWLELIAVYPDKKDDLEEARTSILQTVAEESLSETELTQEIARILASTAPQTDLPVRRIGNRFHWWQAAAIIVLLLGIGWRIWPHQQTPAVNAYDRLVNASTLSLIEAANANQQAKLVRLPDGSQVTLTRLSRISYARDLDKQAKREVFLTGEAFFEVTKNPKQPFFVYANGLVTRVVGTSFNVLASDKNVSVVVRTGRVAVYPFQETKERVQLDETSMLTPNQQATFQVENQQITRTLTKEPKLLTPPDQPPIRYQFDNTPIAEVFDKLERAYGVAIVFDKSVMKDCQVTVHMGEEPFFTKLDIICRTIGASYTIDGTQVIITSTGCIK